MGTLRWNEVEREQMNPLLARQVIHGVNTTLARLEITKGAVVPLHSHVNEQMSVMLKGKLLFVVDGVESIVSAGEVMVIPPNAPHMVEALEDSVRIETPDGERALRNDFVFAMIGYRPDIGFLEAHGIRFDPDSRRPYTNPVSLESDRKGVYLAGVLVAGMHTNEIFIENGRFHGKIIAEAIRAAI